MNHSIIRKPSETRIDEPFETLEKKLREFDFYHGFLPREDLPYVLKEKGAYLLRVSEIEEGKGKVRREVILSVVPHNVNESSTHMNVVPTSGSHTLSKEKESKAQEAAYRNVVIRRAGTRFYTEAAVKPFENLKELFAYYEKNAGHVNNLTFKLEKPVLLQPWELLHSNVHLGRMLGEGAFGEVRAATLKMHDGTTVDVAVKLTKGVDFLNKAKIKEMMNEARIMRNLYHKNVVKLYGVAVHEQPLYIILEFVQGGALNSFLQKNRGNIPQTDKTKMCVGASRGIEYLHSQSIIHRDIAARNCLYVASKREVKISDFGLSRNGQSYRPKGTCKLPIKWLAPEVITTLVFTSKTDVFSFGVMMYEIFAEGMEPWEGYPNSDVKSSVCSGIFLMMPMNCPDEIRDLIQNHIFKKSPHERYDMFTIATTLQKVHLATKPELVPVSFADTKPPAEPPSDTVRYSVSDKLLSVIRGKKKKPKKSDHNGATMSIEE